LPADRERPEGSGRPVADSAAPIYSETGAITGVVLMFTDQSVQRQAQTALRRSEARLRSRNPFHSKTCWQRCALFWAQRR
jgi:hypothetical protein